MENSMKAMVGEEVNKKLASLSLAPSTSSTFVPNVTQYVDGTRETLQRPRTHTAPTYNVAAPSYAPPNVPMPHINHVGVPPLWLLNRLLSGNLLWSHTFEAHPLNCGGSSSTDTIPKIPQT